MLVVMKDWASSLPFSLSLLEIMDHFERETDCKLQNMAYNTTHQFFFLAKH